MLFVATVVFFGKVQKMSAEKLFSHPLPKNLLSVPVVFCRKLCLSAFSQKIFITIRLLIGIIILREEISFTYTYKCDIHFVSFVFPLEKLEKSLGMRIL